MVNKSPIYKMIGASNHDPSSRQDRDFYATSYGAVRPMMEKLSELNIKIPKAVWENSVGAGHIAEALKDLGYDVCGTDIVPLWPESLERPFDFLTEISPPKEIAAQPFSIIGNPPYKLLTEFVIRSLEHIRQGDHLIQFLKLSTLESQKRHDAIYSINPPKHIFQFINRAKSSKNGKFYKGESSAIPYAWFVWEKGFKGTPSLHWIKSEPCPEIDQDITSNIRKILYG